MDNMKVKIDDLVFERANYDADGDALYLTRRVEHGRRCCADARGSWCPLWP